MSNPMGTIDEFVEQNMPLVVHMIKKCYRGQPGIEYEDLFQVGCIGLIKAYRDYDPELSKPSTYAASKIQGEIWRYLRENRYRSVSGTRLAKEVLVKIIRNGLEDRTAEEISAALNIHIKTAENALKLQRTKVFSLEREREDDDDNSLSLHDSIPHYEDFSSAEADDFLSTLTDRERQITEMRMNGCKQKEIGLAVGVTQVQISRILRKIGRKYSEYADWSVSS